jgi:hypothetical protein
MKLMFCVVNPEGAQLSRSCASLGADGRALCVRVRSQRHAMQQGGASGVLLGVSPNTLKHWRWVGKGPRYVKLVSKVAYRQKDLDDWINANVTEPGSK